MAHGLLRGHFGDMWWIGAPMPENTIFSLYSSEIDLLGSTVQGYRFI